MVAKRRRMRTAVEDRLVRFFCCPHKLRPASPSAWRGTAFDCCRCHRTIARKILALLNVVQQAAPGNVSTRGLSERCSIVRSKQRHCRLWPHQETFAGAACQHTLSLENPMFQQRPFNLGQLKAAPLQARRPCCKRDFRGCPE